MPAIHTGGASLGEYGLHFDEAGDSEMGAYDYSAPSPTAAWIRARADGNQIYPTRYKYWKESACEVRGRLQLFIPGVWYDYWQYDLHLIHVYRASSGTQYTQTIQYAGEWLYHSVATVVDAPTCPPNTGDHVHLSGRVYGGGLLSIGPTTPVGPTVPSATPSWEFQNAYTWLAPGQRAAPRLSDPEASLRTYVPSGHSCREPTPPQRSTNIRAKPHDSL